MPHSAPVHDITLGLPIKIVVVFLNLTGNWKCVSVYNPPLFAHTRTRIHHVEQSTLYDLFLLYWFCCSLSRFELKPDVNQNGSFWKSSILLLLMPHMDSLPLLFIRDTKLLSRHCCRRTNDFLLWSWTTRLRLLFLITCYYSNGRSIDVLFQIHNIIVRCEFISRSHLGRSALCIRTVHVYHSNTVCYWCTSVLILILLVFFIHTLI